MLGTQEDKGQTPQIEGGKKADDLPLTIAVVQQDFEAVSSLLAGNTATQHDKDTALFTCYCWDRVPSRPAAKKILTQKMAELLLNDGASIKTLSKLGMAEAVQKSDLAFTLFEHGVEFSKEDLNTLLRRAVRESAGVQIVYCDDNDMGERSFIGGGKRPDWEAVVTKLRTVRKLLRAGADAKIIDDLAVEAVLSNKRDLLETALSAGANPHARNDLALWSVVSGGKKDLVETFAFKLAQRTKDGQETAESLDRTFKGLFAAAAGDKKKKKIAELFVKTVTEKVQAFSPR